MKRLKILLLVVTSTALQVVASDAFGQELGANFNHSPHNIDFEYLGKSTVDWIRTTPRVFQYINGRRDIDSDDGLAKLIEAGERGYRLAFGYRWDFRQHNVRVPPPGSAQESEYFEYARRMLERIGPHVQILKLGNEPTLETLEEDMLPGPDGRIPIVVFTERLLTEVVEPHYARHSDWKRPDVYVGSLVHLYTIKARESACNEALIALAHNNDAIHGLAVNLHIFGLRGIETSFRYIRERMPDKPLIVPEFSLHRLYQQRSNERLGETPAGKAFAEKYKRDPEWKMHEWYTMANTERVSSSEWLDLMLSRPWYPVHYLQSFFKHYRQYGVVLATYPIIQQHVTENAQEDNKLWFLNPIFCPISLQLEADGTYGRNPLAYNDFIDLVEAGRPAQASLKD
jgi:hypothetical protein